MSGYGVLVVWQDGRQPCLRKEPSGDRMEFDKRRHADETVELLRAGLLPEAQSVNVVCLDHRLEAGGMMVEYAASRLLDERLRAAIRRSVGVRKRAGAPSPAWGPGGPRATAGQPHNR